MIMVKKYSDYLNTDEAVLAHKCLDFYDGKQEKWMIQYLNDPNKGHRDWVNRGFVPRFRNITKMIVDKSGLLFIDQPPKIQLFPTGSEVEDEIASKIILELYTSANWEEFFTNFDSLLRLLKTAIVLVQYDAFTGLVFDILHKGNSEVILDEKKNVSTLIYRTSSDEEKHTIRVWTAETIKDVEVVKGIETVVSEQDNPYGFIPMSTFHDTNTPRTGFWNVIQNDIIQINEMFNIHLIDSEYAARWAKLPTLFTNARRADDGTGSNMVVQEVNGSPLPRMVPETENALIGGPNKVVTIDTSQTDGNVILDYKTPVVDLKPLDEIFTQWVKDFAYDWSVNMKTSGTFAESGFKLVVEEINNLQLRKKRQKMFESGMKKLFEVVKDIINVVSPGLLPDNLELYADFQPPFMPVNEKEREDIWTIRISQGRATRVDYFMEVHGMSRIEAEKKVAEIDADRKPKEIKEVQTRDFDVRIAKTTE